MLLSRCKGNTAWQWPLEKKITAPLPAPGRCSTHLPNEWCHHGYPQSLLTRGIKKIHKLHSSLPAHRVEIFPNWCDTNFIWDRFIHLLLAIHRQGVFFPLCYIFRTYAPLNCQPNRSWKVHSYWKFDVFVFVLFSVLMCLLLQCAH